MYAPERTKHKSERSKLERTELKGEMETENGEEKLYEQTRKAKRTKETEPEKGKH
jgi:hypothetical protein